MTAAAELWVRLALLGLAAVIAECLLRRANGAVRHALWVVVVAAALALPVARVSFEERTWTVSWWRVSAAGAPMETTLPEAVTGSGAAGRQNSAGGKNVHYGWWLYAAVAAALLVRQARAALRLRDIERAAEPVQPDEALDVAARLGLVEQVEFLTSAAVDVPYTTGWKRCRIFLPADWADWPGEKRRSVLAHEMAHVERGDWLVSRAAAVIRAVCWAHPLFWWAERRLAALAEEAVDETAIALTGDARAYAGAILDFALARTEQFELMETTAMARSSKVGSRVERILSHRNFNMARMGRLTAAGIVGAALPLLYAAALIEPAPQQAPSPATTTYLTVAPVGPAPAQAPPASKSELAAAEARVTANPEDPLARLELLHKLIQSGRRAEAESHTVWLVENHPTRPEAMVATQFFVSQFGPTSAGRRLSAQWRRNAERYPGDASVLAAAARMARLDGEYVRADALLRQALVLKPEWQPAQSQRAELYLLALLAGSGVVVTPVQPEPAFVQSAQRLADSGTEMPLAGAVGELMIPPDSLIVQSEQAAERARKSRAERIQVAERLLRRAGELDPESPRWKAAMERLQRAKAGGGVTVEPLPATEPGAKRITVGGNVQASMLVKSAEPEYPPLARQARIQGTVRFYVVIDKAGSVASMRLISGHPLLVQAAKDALQKYEYKPTTLGGEPVEVATQVDVNFKLGPPEEAR